jgi:hypothetical protein
LFIFFYKLQTSFVHILKFLRDLFGMKDTLIASFLGQEA